MGRGRPKGFKLSAEQKARMAAGRRNAKMKRQEGLIQEKNIDKKSKIKKEENECQIVGYIMDKGDSMPCPVFKSEQYKGKTYKTPEEARKAVK